MPAKWSGPASSHLPDEGSGVAGSPSAAVPSPSPEPAPGGLSSVLSAFLRISEALTRPGESERLFRTLAEEAASLLAPASAIVCTLETGGDVLQARIGTGVLARCEGEFLPVEGSLEGRAVLAGEPQRSPDLLADPRAYRARDRGLPAGPALAVPLGSPGAAVGALLVARAPGEPEFAAHEVHRVALLAEVAASAIRNAREYERARASRAMLEAWRREREAASWLARYVAAARAAQSVVFEWDPASDRVLWGDTLEGVVGHPAGEYAETMGALLERAHPDDRERAREGVEAARSGAPLRLPLRLPHRNAPFRCFVLQARPVEGGEGRVVGVLEDVTDEWRKPPESRKRAETPARQIIRALRHEINNPLAVILGQAQLLGREDLVQGDPVLRSSIGTIHEEGQRILELTRRLAALEQTDREPQVARNGGIAAPEE